MKTLYMNLQRNIFRCMLLVILSLAIQQQTMAQSWTLQNSTVTDDLNDIARNFSGHLFAVGNNSKILRSTDQGVTWTPVSSPITADFRRISFSTGFTYGYILTSQGAILRTLDNGDTWSPVTVPTEISGNIVDVEAKGGELFVLLGNSAQVYRSTSAGGNLTPYHNPSSPSLSYQGRDLEVRGSRVYFASTSRYHREVSAGTFESKVLTRSGFVTSVFAISNNFFVGEDGRIERTDDGGANWINLSSPVSTDLHDVAATSSSVFIVGAQGKIYKSVNNGFSWQNSGSGTTNNLNAILVDTDVNNAWVVGAGGTILRTTNGGTCPTPLQPSVIVGPTSINTGVQGNYSVSNVAGVTYNWFAGTGGVVTGSGSAVQITWSSAGTKTITVTATTNCGTSVARTLTVTASTCALPAQPTLSQGSAVGCQFQSSTVSVNSVAGVSYTWSLSGGGVITGTGNTAVVTWSAAGTFTVSVTPSNACGSGIARTLNVVVTGTPASPSAIAGNATVCTGVSTAYNVTNVAGLTYTWDTGGAGTVSGSGNAVNITWTSSGAKTLTLSATNTCGAVTTRTQAITVNPSPSQPSVIAGSTSVTTGIANQYSVTNEAGITYAWNAGAGGTVTGSGNSVNISWSSAGSKTITLTPSNACGNGTTRTLNVTVSDCAMPAQPTTITGSTTACVNASGIYSVTNTGGVTYTWNAGADGFVSGSGNSVTLSWTSVGTKNVTVTPSNSCGNGTSRTLSVTVNQLPAQPSAIAGSIAPCKDASIAYSVSSVAGVTYTWDIIGTGTITGSGNSVNVTWTATGTHTLRVTPSNACGAGVARTIEVVVNDVPLAASQMTGLTAVCAGTSIPYSVGNVAGVTYTWSAGSGGTITGSTSAVSISWSTGGTKTVSVTPSNACGNGTASTKTVEVSTTPAQPSTIVGSTAAVGGISQSYSVTNIPGVTYTWSTNADGVIASSGNTAQVTWATAGAKTVTVTPSNLCGNGTARTLSVTATVPCTIPGTPSSMTIGLGGSSNIALNDFRRFVVGASSGATSLNIAVSPSAGTTITPVFGNTWDIVFTIPGTYTVSGFGEISGCGAGAPANITVEVCTGTVATPTAINGSNVDVCSGTTKRYSVTPVQGVVFDWSLGSISSGTISPLNADRSIVDITWSSTFGGDNLTVRAKNACNVQSSTFTLTVLSKGKPSFAGFGMVLTGSICAGSGGALSMNIGLPEPATTYTWQLNGAGTVAGDNLSASALADGLSRQIKIYGTNACFQDEFITAIDYGGGSPIPVTPSPVSGPSTINVNTIGSYSVDAQQPGVNFSWDAGSDATITAGASANIKNIQWSTGGLKTVFVNAVNTCGDGYRSFSVFVNGPCVAPSVPGTISGTTSVCAGVEYQYSVPFQGFDTFNWSAGADATITGSGSIRTIKWSTGGAKTISVTATNLCTTSTAQTLGVTVNTIPSQPATLTGLTSGCNGATQQISLASPVAGVTYTWEVQGGTVVTSGAQGQIADITWTATGVNEVKLKPSNACGNGTARTLNVTVGTVPDQPSIIAGESEVCSATSKAYSVTNVAGVTYAWNAGSGGTVTGSGNAVSISWSTTGAKTITLTPSNACGNGITRTLSVTVIGAPAQPALITGVASPMLGDQEFYAVSSVAGVNYTWSLSDKGTLTGSGNNASVFWNTPGSATLSVTPSNTCGNGVVRNTSITINKISQSISFTLASPVLANQVINLEATSTSGLPVTYVSSNTSVAEVINNELILKASGAVNITASQAGDETFAAASPVIRSLTINKANQAITFVALSSATFGEGDVELEGTSDSGLPLSYTSSNTSVATISGNVITIVGAGSSNITATQGGNAIYNAATPVMRTLTVNKADQTITFEPLVAKSVSDPPFSLSATASSSLSVSYVSSNPAVATIAGNTVTLVGQGTTTITASQIGNVNYNAAATVDQVLVVNDKQSQSISFSALPAKTFGDADFSLSATASSGLSVIYSSSNTSVATISGTMVTIVGVGSTTITATQTGDASFNPANPVQQSLVVIKADQSISFSALGTKVLSSGSAELTASSSSGLTVTYTSSNTNVATISGNTITLVSAGSATITALQDGNENYNAAPAVEQLLVVTDKQTQSITFNALIAKTFGDPSFDLSASASSGLGVSYESSNTTVATISGSIVTIVGAGTTTITASQAGNDEFDAAASVEQVLVVNKANQTITFSLPATANFTDGTLNVIATTSANLPVSFVSSNASVATLNGNTLSFLTPGTVEITASQIGNNNYNAASNVTASITIVDDRPSITLSGSLDFGDVLQNETAERTLTITNNGNGILNVSTIAVPVGFTASTSSATVNAQSSTTVTISFTPTELKKYTGSLVVVSNAPGGAKEISVTGTGTTITGFNEPGQPAGELEVYPNPGKGLYTLKGKMTNGKLVSITDLSGRSQERRLLPMDEENHQLDITDLPQGVYYIKVEEKGSIAVKRIVKLN